MKLGGSNIALKHKKSLTFKNKNPPTFDFKYKNPPTFDFKNPTILSHVTKSDSVNTIIQYFNNICEHFSYLAVREDMCRKEYHVVYRTEQCRGLWYRFRVFSLIYRNPTAEHLYQEMQVCRHVTGFTSCQNKSDICERENSQKDAQNY